MRIPFTSFVFSLLAASGAYAQGGPARSDSGWSGAGAEARARAQADSMRAEILRYATFAGFGDTTCAPGELRTFERDTLGVTKKLLGRLESLVLSFGAYQSLDNPAGKALLRAVTRLETGGPGPRWDTMSGTGPRAFNPMLPIKMMNSDTKACEMTPGSVPDGLALPAVTGFDAPRDSGAFSVDVEASAQAINTIRNRFFARHAAEPNATMHHSRVNAYSMWGDYAIILVSRQAELKGVVAMAKEASGSVYAFHRVGAEWRVLALVRSW